MSRFSAWSLTSYSYRLLLLILACRFYFSPFISSTCSLICLILFSFSTSRVLACFSSSTMAAWIFSISVIKFYSSVSFSWSSRSYLLILDSRSSISSAYFWKALLIKNLLSQIRQILPSLTADEGDADPLRYSGFANSLFRCAHFSQARCPQKELFIRIQVKRVVNRLGTYQKILDFLGTSLLQPMHYLSSMW